MPRIEDAQELAAYMVGKDPEDYDGICERLEQKYLIEYECFEALVNDLVTLTVPFESSLVKGELIQAFVRRSDDGKALNALLRVIIPPVQAT